MRLTLVKVQPHAAGAASFWFQPAEPVRWIAGQSVRIEVPGFYGPLEHRFTISSAPHEGYLAITTRLSDSDYKQSLFSLQPGDELQAYGVEGDFVWPNAPGTHLFVAAGIGITPFFSMLKQRLHEGLPPNALLLYGSTTPEIIFKSQFDEWAEQQPSFAVRYVTGRRITADDVLRQEVDGLILLSGPSALVDELARALIAAGVPASRLLSDRFTGRLPD